MFYIDLLFILILLSSQISENNLGFFKVFYKDFKGTISSPFRWKLKDWLYAGLIIGVTLALYKIDSNITSLIRHYIRPFTITIAKMAKLCGDGNFLFISISVFYICGIIFKNERAKKTALLCLESLLITAFFIQILKFSFHRHRPSSGDLFNTFDGPGLQGANLAFPSGHASAAFSVLSIIALEYSELPIIPFLAYSIATLTALSRVHDNAHWASDVFFGGALAFFIARNIIDSHKETVLPQGICSKIKGFLCLWKNKL
ncbi:MAG: phosphatase PAP2 family protein [Nitrospirae bacterium]|nr:phosphatase PAP2 family protein [Nitrospirota bacterium]